MEDLLARNSLSDAQEAMIASKGERSFWEHFSLQNSIDIA